MSWLYKYIYSFLSLCISMHVAILYADFNNWLKSYKSNERGSITVTETCSIIHLPIMLSFYGKQHAKYEIACICNQDKYIQAADALRVPVEKSNTYIMDWNNSPNSFSTHRKFPQPYRTKARQISFILDFLMRHIPCTFYIFFSLQCLCFAADLMNVS